MSSVICVLQQIDSSLPTLEAAYRKAESLRGNLIVLFVYRLTGLEKRDEIIKVRKEREQIIRNKFLELRKELTLGFEVPTEFRIEIGFISDRIEYYLQSNTVDCLVMDAETASYQTDHEGITLRQYLETLKVPVQIVGAYVKP